MRCRCCSHPVLSCSPNRHVNTTPHHPEDWSPAMYIEPCTAPQERLIPCKRLKNKYQTLPYGPPGNRRNQPPSKDPHPNPNKPSHQALILSSSPWASQKAKKKNRIHSPTGKRGKGKEPKSKPGRSSGSKPISLNSDSAFVQTKHIVEGFHPSVRRCFRALALTRLWKREIKSTCY